MSSEEEADYIEDSTNSGNTFQNQGQEDDAARDNVSQDNVSQDMFEMTSLASEAGMTVATSATSTTTGSLPSIIRRSSAPEIDESLNPDALSRISEVTTSGLRGYHDTPRQTAQKMG